MPTLEDLKARAEAIKKSLWVGIGASRHTTNIMGAIQSSLSILASVYGAASNQVRGFENRIAPGQCKADMQPALYERRVAIDIESAIDAAIADLEGGIASPLGARAKAEVLGDFLGLARESLDAGTPEAHRVAAVLTAAALEETLKQLGVARGVDVVNRDMRGVIEKLRQAEILVGAQLSLAQGLVRFRDHAFHAQFDMITPAATESAFIFVQQILTTEFK